MESLGGLGWIISIYIISNRKTRFAFQQPPGTNPAREARLPCLPQAAVTASGLFFSSSSICGQLKSWGTGCKTTNIIQYQALSLDLDFLKT